MALPASSNFVLREISDNVLLVQRTFYGAFVATLCPQHQPWIDAKLAHLLSSLSHCPIRARQELTLSVVPIIKIVGIMVLACLRIVFFFVAFCYVSLSSFLLNCGTYLCLDSIFYLTNIKHINLSKMN